MVIISVKIKLYKSAIFPGSICILNLLTLIYNKRLLTFRLVKEFFYKEMAHISERRISHVTHAVSHFTIRLVVWPYRRSVLRNDPGTLSRLLILGAIKSGGTLSLLHPESKLHSPGTCPFPPVFLPLSLNPPLHL